MCGPAPAIVAGIISVATSAANVVAQSKAAKAQTKAIRNQQAVVAEENRKAASAELFDQMRATRREQARVRAAAGEAGLGLNSGSVEALLMDSAMQGELQADRTIANMESRTKASDAEAASMLSRIQKPTALGAGLQIGSSAASAWAGVKEAKIARGEKAPAPKPKPKTKK